MIINRNRSLRLHWKDFEYEKEMSTRETYRYQWYLTLFGAFQPPIPCIFKFYRGHPITDAVISKNQSDCQQWLESHDLTSPWQGAINSASKKLNRSRISSKSYSKGIDAWTQTATSLPPNFNLFEFLERHGAPIQVFFIRERLWNRTSGLL